MAIEYCVRCGKRVTGDETSESGRQRLCVWCLDKNPIKGQTGRREAPAPTESSTAMVRVLRSPALWIGVVALAGAALAVGLLMGRMGGDDDRTVQAAPADAERLKADFASDTAFERRKELASRYEALKAGGGPALESAALDYEHRRELAASCRRESILRDAETLAAEEKYDEALKALASFPDALRETPAARQVETRHREVSSMAEAFRALKAVTWSLRFWNFTPVKGQPPEWEKVIQGPSADVTWPELHASWGVGGHHKLAPDGFAAEAVTEIDLPARDYVITIQSDDGARIWIDDKLIFANWQPHAVREDRTVVTLAAGRHRFRVDFYELFGDATLIVKIKPKP